MKIGKIKKEIRNFQSFTLSSEEKFAMEQDFRRLSGLPEEKFSKVSSWWNFAYLSNFRIVAASVVIIFFSLASLSYAAEGALPGDLLHPIKTKVNEKILRAINASNLEKAEETEVKILERRLAEAEKLEEKSELKNEIKENVRVELHKQIERAGGKEKDREEKEKSEKTKKKVREIIEEKRDLIEKIDKNKKNVPLENGGHKKR